MKTAAVFCAVAALAGCASSSVRRPVPTYRDGLGPDLRIYTDDVCLAGLPVTRSGLGLAGELVKGVASLAMKSFGRFLEEVGSPEIETASGVHPDLYFDDKADPPVINPKLRCIYIVRDGFEQKGFSSAAPQEMRQTWERLKLTGTPSFYMMMRLDLADDGSDVFRGTVLELGVDRFSRVGAENARDYVVSVEMGMPSTSRSYTVNDKGEIILNAAGPFTHGGVALRGIQHGAYLGAAELKGVETGWMSAPQRPTNTKNRQPINIYVDVVELKRGNAFIADLGRFLQSSAVTDAAGQQALTAVNSGERDKAQAAAAVDAEKAEIALVHALEGKQLALRTEMADKTSTPARLLTAIQGAEDAVSNIDFQKRSKGWRSPYPDALIKDIAEQTVEARVKLNAMR